MKCSSEESYTLDITLTGCNDTEFTCKDGSCISMEDRCDDKTDCYDETDEDDCSLVKLNTQYKKELVPPPKGNSLRLGVNISVDIESVGKIDIVGGVIEIVYKLRRTWYDSRLMFQNLKTDNEHNKIKTENIKDFWFPVVKFQNMYSPQSFSEYSVLANWTIIRNTTYINKNF